ncbi:MAG TPA: RidA family protein, partial [Acetobacteraceae bacterium]|nr:RidA family protein [Acetobacteraceae bacterium]
RDIPPTLEAQVANLFIHLRAAITAAGGTPDDFLKIDFWAKDQNAGRAALNGEWEKMFPDPDARPARHTQALPADSRAMIQCAFTAVLG